MEIAMNEKKIFWLGSPKIDEYYGAVFSDLLDDELLMGYMSWSLIDDKKGEHLEFVDCTLLAMSEDIREAFKDYEWTFGSAITVEGLQKYSPEVSAALDRTTPRVMSAMGKEIYFNILAGFCIAYFEKNAEILVVCQNSPHMPFDILFCRIASDFGIKVYSINHALPGYSVVWEGIGANASIVTGSSANKKSLIEASEIFENDAKKNNEKFRPGYEDRSSWISVSTEAYNRSGVLNLFIELIKLPLKKVPIIRELPKAVQAYMIGPPVQMKPASLTSRQISTMAGDPIEGKLEYAMHVFRYALNRNKIISGYKNLAVKSWPEDKPFIYFALHQQPERTTLPDGDIYREQLLALRRISESMPDDMILLVKEHPAQSGFDLRNMHQRSEEFYNLILQIPKTKLIDGSVSSELLLENCVLCGTITGSSLNEALARGRPVIFFGNAFISGCKSAFRAANETFSFRDQLKQLIMKSESEVRSDYEEFLSHNNFHDFLDSDYWWIRAGRNPDQPKRLSQFIKGLLKRDL